MHEYHSCKTSYLWYFYLPIAIATSLWNVVKFSSVASINLLAFLSKIFNNS